MIAAAPYPLGAASPAEWMDRHLAAYFHDGHLLDDDGGAELRMVGIDELTGGVLADRYAAELVEGWTPQAAMTSVVGTFASSVAGLVAFAAFASGAHWLVRADTLRWHLGDDDWPVAATLGVHDVLVPPGHPWSGQAGVTVEPDDALRAARCVDAVVAALEPIVEHACTIRRVGRAGLWNVVADSFGHALMYQGAFPAHAGHADVVRAMIEAPDRPWKSGPDVRGLATEHGDICVAQRGGCCLVYTVDWPDADDGHEDDDIHARFHAAFPDPPDAPGYCNDCSLRTEDDCMARLVWWRTEELKVRAADPSSA